MDGCYVLLLGVLCGNVLAKLAPEFFPQEEEDGAGGTGSGAAATKQEAASVLAVDRGCCTLAALAWVGFQLHFALRSLLLLRALYPSHAVHHWVELCWCDPVVRISSGR